VLPVTIRTAYPSVHPSFRHPANRPSHALTIEVNIIKMVEEAAVVEESPAWRKQW